MFRMSGKRFRTFAHPPDAMVDVAARRGLREVYRHRGPLWQVVGLERGAA
jgi:magnesium-protoporphyrin O-methyltransferase